MPRILIHCLGLKLSLTPLPMAEPCQPATRGSAVDYKYKTHIPINTFLIHSLPESTNYSAVWVNSNYSTYYCMSHIAVAHTQVLCGVSFA